MLPSEDSLLSENELFKKQESYCNSTIESIADRCTEGLAIRGTSYLVAYAVDSGLVPGLGGH